MHGMMNNTKWREVLCLLAGYPVYIQLKRRRDADFHIDYERADRVISAIEAAHFTYIHCQIAYHELDQLKIYAQPRPDILDEAGYRDLLAHIGALIPNNLQSVPEALLVRGYDG